MKKQITAFLLTALMVGSAVLTLSACSDGKRQNTGAGTGSSGGTVPGGTSGTSQGSDPTLPEVAKPGVPDGVRFDTDGEKTVINFVVAETDAANGDSFNLRSVKLDADEVLTTDKVDSAVANRNAIVEDSLGVEINVLEYLTTDIRRSEVYTAISAQSADYDVLAGHQWNDVQISLDGTLTNLTTMTDGQGNKLDYLSLDKPWWSGYYIDALKMGSSDSLYWVTGDLNLRYTGGYYCFFVNEKLYRQDLLDAQSDLLTQKYGEPTKYGMIYDLVSRGDWTLDVFSEMIARAYHDNGDEKVGPDDVLGAAMPVNDNINGMSVAAGVQYSEKTDGGVTLLADTGNLRLIDFMTKVNKILKSGYIYNYVGDYKTAFADFAGDGACFVSGRLNQAELYLTGMSSNYHIIPCPKMDFDQDQYRSSVHDGINLYGISYYSQKKAAAAATLEEMAFYAYRDVRPIYYDQALKNLYTTDPGSAQMIDLMHDVVYSDFVYIWQFTQYFGGGTGGIGLGDFLRKTVGSSKPSSMIAQHQTVWRTGLAELLEDVEKLEKG